MSSCTFRLLGSPQIVHDGRVTRVHLRKSVALLAYLAIEKREFSRELLATLLWPDMDARRSLRNLRVTLSHLRSILPDGCVTTDGDVVLIDSNLVRTDVDEFRSFVAAATNQVDTNRLEAAAEIYRGSFLEGLVLGDCEEFDQWQASVRLRLETELDSVLESLTNQYRHAGKLASALAHARRWLDLDPLNQAAHRAIIEIRHQMGRVDLAWRQYESCVAILARENVKLEESTRQLIDAVSSKHDDRAVGPQDDGPQAPESEGPNAAARLPSPRGSLASADADDAGVRRVHVRRRRLVKFVGVPVVVLLVASVVVSAIIWPPGFFRKPDFSMLAVAVAKRYGEFAGYRVEAFNEANAHPSAHVALFVSGNEVIGTDRTFQIYAGLARIRRDETNVYIEPHQLEKYANDNGVRVPPGYYIVRATLSPAGRLPDANGLDNSLSTDDVTWFPGVGGVEYIEGVISRGESSQPDRSSPLKVAVYPWLEGWEYPTCYQEFPGPFRVANEGRCFFPLETSATLGGEPLGTTLVVIRDAGDDLLDAGEPGPGDVVAVYRRDAPGHLVYGSATPESGSVVEYGARVEIRFDPPPRPGPDQYEPDDDAALDVAVLRLSDLPVLQHHTFHDDGQMDQDWFRVYLRAGESVIIETSSDGGPWECWTAIDVSNSRMEFLGTGDGKDVAEGLYSILEFTNDTGYDQEFRFLVKPYNQYSFGVDGSGQYIVELRGGTNT